MAAIKGVRSPVHAEPHPSASDSTARLNAYPSKMAIGRPTCPPRSARVVWNPVPKNGYEKGITKDIAYVYRCITVTYQIHHDSCRDSHRSGSASRAAASHRGQSREAASRRRHADPLRHQLELRGGPVLPAGCKISPKVPTRVSGKVATPQAVESLAAAFENANLPCELTIIQVGDEDMVY